MRRRMAVLWVLLCFVFAVMGCGGGGSTPGSEGGGNQNMGTEVLGQLPTPLAVPAGSQDEVAAILAKEVLAGGNNALPALLTAIQTAGFSIKYDDNVLIKPQSFDQGLAFEAWQVQAMAKQIGDGLYFSSSEIFTLLAGVLDELQDAPLESFILDDIRAHAQGDTPLRFWARFIVEMGKQSSQPYDLLSTPGVSNVRLNSVQMSFITLRLAGDLWAFTQAGEGAAAKTNVKTQTKKAALRSAETKHPCTLEGMEGTVMDMRVLTATTGFGVLMDYLELKGMKSAGTIGTIANISNLVSTGGKLLAFFMLSDIAIDLEGNDVLERTKETTPGEQRILSATVSMDTAPDTQWINCARLAFASAGLDFSVPNAGPVKDATVEWEIEKGFSNPDLVEFLGGSDKGYGTPTNDQGISKIMIEGRAQNTAVPENAKPVIKDAVVEADVAFKSPDLYQDLVDVGGVTAGALLGGAPWTIPTTIAEFFMRIPGAIGKSYPFQVKDWAYKRVKFNSWIHRDCGKEGGLVGSTDMRVQTEIDMNPDCGTSSSCATSSGKSNITYSSYNGTLADCTYTLSSATPLPVQATLEDSSSSTTLRLFLPEEFEDVFVNQVCDSSWMNGTVPASEWSWLMNIMYMDNYEFEINSSGPITFKHTLDAGNCLVKEETVVELIEVGEEP